MTKAKNKSLKKQEQQIVQPIKVNEVSVPKHLQPLEEENVVKLKLEQGDDKEMITKIEELKKEIKVAKKPDLTDGQKIWNEIKNVPITMFGLNGKVVSDYCKTIDLVPTKCFLIQSVSSVLPMLEMAIGANRPGSKYVVELQGKYIMVSRG